jgi:hypothetical protein
MPFATHNRSKHHWWVDGRNREVWLLLLEEVPCCALGEGLAGAVAVGGVLDCLFGVDGVPVFFAVGVFWPVAFEGVDDGGEGGGDDYALDGGGGLFDGFQDAGCADDGWVEEFLWGG